MVDGRRAQGLPGSECHRRHGHASGRDARGPAGLARREPWRRDNPRWSVGHEWLPPNTADAAGARTHSVGVHGRVSTPCGRLCHSTQSAARRRLALRRRNGATGESSLMAERPLSEFVEDAFIRCRDLQAPLTARLQAFADELRRLRPHFAEAVDALVNRLVESDAGATAPKVGELMPEFLLPDEQGRLVRLNDLLGEGPVAIVFNRGQWCPYCRINVDALARAEEEVATEHRHLAAIVPDRQKFAMWHKSDAKAIFPLLTAVDTPYAMYPALAFFPGAQIQHMMVNSGWDPSVSHGTDNWTLPIPATFIVGTDGIVQI